MMRAAPTEQAQDDLLIHRDAAIDSLYLWDRIRENQASRVSLPPLAAALGRQRMDEERQKILHSIRELQDRIRDCGLIRARRSSWIAAVELWIKKCIRKLFFRHLLQQHRVHLKLATVLNQLVHYLEEHDRCLRACIDQSTSDQASR
jgi:hypothetical protein